MPISPAEYTALAEFRRALRQFLHFSEQAAREAGLTPQQHQALLAIMGAADPDAVTVGELADSLQIRHHSAVGLIDRLAAQDLVERRPAPNDRRSVHVALTQRGLDVLEGLTAAHRSELRRLGPQLGRIFSSLAADPSP